MADNGFIKLYRKILDWEWYDDPDTFRLFIHLLLRANYEDGMWQGQIIKKGSLVTSRAKLSKETGLSEQKIRNQLNNLQTTNEITIKSTKHYSIIELVKWDDYNQQNNQQNKRKTTNKTTTIKEYNTEEDKNIETWNIEWVDSGKSENNEETKPVVTINPNKIQADFLWVLRKSVGVDKFKDYKEWTEAWLTLKLYEKLWEEEFLKRLKWVLSDQFKAKNCNKLEYLRREIESFIHSPIINQSPPWVVQA